MTCLETRTSHRHFEQRAQKRKTLGPAVDPTPSQEGKERNSELLQVSGIEVLGSCEARASKNQKAQRK